MTGEHIFAALAAFNRDRDPIYVVPRVNEKG